jgi:hypothetical protein
MELGVETFERVWGIFYHEEGDRRGVILMR